MARSCKRMTTAASFLALMATVAIPGTKVARAADEFADVRREITARHDEAVKRLQDWIALPSIAAESLNSAAIEGSAWRSWRATPASRR